MAYASKKYALVTGGSGFLGTNLVKRLLKEKRRVKILDIRKPKVKGAAFILGDVTNFGDVMKAAKDAGVVFHLASVTPQLNMDEKIYRNVIIKGTENILKACKRYKIKLVHISSTSVYGANREGVLKENAEKKPYSGYGKNKWEAEKLCQKYAKGGVEVVILRPMAIIGPEIGGIVMKFLKFMRYNLPLITIGAGSNRIQMLSVSDCVDAMLKAEKYDKSGEVFNLGSENVTTFRNQLKQVTKNVKSKSVVIPLPSYPAKKFFEILYKLKIPLFVPEHYEMLDKNCIVDVSKAKNLLKWRPKKDNIQMMVEAYNWYKNNDKIRTQ